MINGLIVPVSDVIRLFEEKEAQLKKELNLENEDSVVKKKIIE